MKIYVKKVINVLIPVFGILILISCQNKQYEKLDDGVIVYLFQKSETEAKAVKLQVVTDKIIHVTATPGKIFSDRKSLTLEEKQRPPVQWSLEEYQDTLRMSTSSINAVISLKTGEISFADKNGNIKLDEKGSLGKSFIQDTLAGKTVFKIRQCFSSPDDKAFYGLGGFQDGFMNYKGKNQELLQQNMVAINPFLVSSKNYGILWENYSISRFGAPREYQHIDELECYDENGEPGGLTAKYIINSNPAKEFLKRTESKIDYEFREQGVNWPKGYPVTGNTVVWTGSIASEYTGLHKFLLYSSCYTKVWLGNTLMVDNWKQVWLPGTDPIDFHMEKGKKYPVKIEWTADDSGIGPYIAFKWLSQVDEKEQNDLSLSSEVADQIDYYYIDGDDPDGVISGYRDLTGKATIMPKWAMGLWQSRERYKNSEKLIDVVKEFRKRQIPLDNIVLDWLYWGDGQWGSHEFDPVRFPDPVGMINDLHEKYNTRIMISVWPKFNEGTNNYKLFNDKGWLYKRNIETGTKDGGHIYSLYDAFNPDTRKLNWQLMDSLLYKKGIDAWWMDASEPEMLSNISNKECCLRMNPTESGSDAEYINAYSLVHSKGVYNGQRQTNPDQRVFIFTRSAFAGQQRYAAATWSGDLAARWDDLKNQIPSGLNFSLSGIPYWTSDIGGFSVERRFSDKDGNDPEWRELMTRWFQFGTFCPLLKVHGQYPYREMFNVALEDHAAYKTMVKFDKLRYRLMPYIYSLAGHAYFKNSTIMRALVMDFGKDQKVFNIGDQYMFGPALMVCPVYQYNARARELYLPENTGWYNLFTGEYYAGGNTIEADAPLDIIPIFVKEGSILPIGHEIQFTTEKHADPITLFVYTGKDGEFTLYEDENVNYNYERGGIPKFRYAMLNRTKNWL